MTTHDVVAAAVERRAREEQGERGASHGGVSSSAASCIRRNINSDFAAHAR